jgi:hypothetical protein
VNPNLEMVTNKLQFIFSSQMNSEQKVLWLKQWNQSLVLRQVQKFLETSLLNAIFEKWLHKAIF